MKTVIDTDLLLAEREAGRYADAAQDAVTLLAQGRAAEAAEVLDEVARRATDARERLQPKD